MQCLFCGKELALLKRLRGGGEFCSEAHRKEYQEQYEQLALARLLQAKPPSGPAAPLGRPSAGLTSDPVPESPRGKVPAPAPEPQFPSAHSIATIEAPASSQSNAEKAAEREPAEEASPAPLAGFLSEPVVPAVTVCQVAGLLELERVTAPSLPSGVVSARAGISGGSTDSAPSASEGRLHPAPRVDLELSLQAVDYHTRKSERGMELREFAGAAPLIELHLRPTTGTEPAGAADVMEILMSPHPPQKATPWLGVPRGFPATPAELGQLARLDFATTGFASSGAFAYSDGPASGRVAPQPAALTPELPPQAEPPSQTAMAAPAPAETSAPAEPPPPELVTKALPVTLHGLAAPRGKAMQTFTSAITAASDIQIPPSATLPLRPAIVFGPSPAPTRPPVAATAPAQPKPAQPKPAQSKPPQSKPTQPEKTVQTAPTERVKPSVVPPPKPVPVKRSVAPETPIQERNAPKVSAPAAAPANQPADQRADSHLEPRPESSAHRSLEASAATDAAFPSLRLEATEGAWAKLSMNLKIGVAAAVIVGVSGIAFVVTRGGSKTNGEAPAAAASVNPGVASGVPISGGWIDDWANAAKTRRHISLLSGSAKLSDYRMEFQAQIETKAIGWIFRGLNPRNYYVAKLETITPGLEPTVALVHFAVVDGQDEDRVVVPLPMKVRVDTNYKIRFDAIGTRFTAWIQDQKIAEWTDSRFGSGGVGFFSEQNEKAAMQGTVNVVALVPKN